MARRVRKMVPTWGTLVALGMHFLFLREVLAIIAVPVVSSMLTAIGRMTSSERAAERRLRFEDRVAGGEGERGRVLPSTGAGKALATC